MLRNYPAVVSRVLHRREARERERVIHSEGEVARRPYTMQKGTLR